MRTCLELILKLLSGEHAKVEPLEPFLGAMMLREYQEADYKKRSHTDLWPDVHTRMLERPIQNHLLLQVGICVVTFIGLFT